MIQLANAVPARNPTLAEQKSDFTAEGAPPPDVVPAVPATAPADAVTKKSQRLPFSVPDARNHGTGGDKR